MNNVFITYRHLRRDTSSSNSGGVTLAIYVDMRDPEDRKLMFAYALCNPDMDNFNKSEGRRVAYRRLSYARKAFQSGYTDITFAGQMTYSDKEDGTIVEQILNFVDENPEQFQELQRYLQRYVYE